MGLIELCKDGEQWGEKKQGQGVASDECHHDEHTARRVATEIHEEAHNEIDHQDAGRMRLVEPRGNTGYQYDRKDGPGLFRESRKEVGHVLTQHHSGKEIAGVGERQGYSAMGQGASGNDEEKRREERGERYVFINKDWGLRIGDWRGKD